MTLPPLRPLSVGEMLDVSFGLYRRHFVVLLTVALVCIGVPVLANVFLQAAGGIFAVASAAGALTGILLFVAYLAVWVVFNFVGVAASVFVVSESYLGRSVEAGDALRRAMPFLGRLVANSVLFSLLVFIGGLLFIVPGVIIACGLALATPVIVLEPGRDAVGALGRSWELSKGGKGRIFLMFVVLAVLLYIPILAIGVVAAMVLPGQSGLAGAAGAGPIFGMALTALMGLVQVFVYPLFYCMLTVAYYDQRVRKEGFDLELLAASLQPA